jgi:hypothetical protein
LIEQITVPTWLTISAETRMKLREIFKINQSSHTQVVTDQFGKPQVLSDGCTDADLQAITVEKLRDFLGTAASDETIYDLFKLTVRKVEKPGMIETASVEEKHATNEPVAPTNDIKADSRVVGDTLKCEKCAFETRSKFAMRMHMGKKHK